MNARQIKKKLARMVRSIKHAKGSTLVTLKTLAETRQVSISEARDMMLEVMSQARMSINAKQRRHKNPWPGLTFEATIRPSDYR